MTPVSALGGAVHEGAVTIREMPPRTMISLRGDLSSSRFRKAVTEVAGVGVPAAGAASADDDRAVLWMSPDEVLLIAPRAVQADSLPKLERALAGTHHLAADVSDARSVFRLEGEDAHIREVLAKLTPADVHPGSLPVGAVRRTGLAQVPAAFWFRSGTAAELLAFRSVSSYVFGVLKTASAAGPVGHF